MQPFNLLSLTILLVALDGCVSNLQAGGTVDFEIMQSGVTPASGASCIRKVEFIHNQRCFAEALSSYSNVAAEQIDFSANQVV